MQAEIGEHDAILDDLTRGHAPTLREAIGIGALAESQIGLFKSELIWPHGPGATAATSKRPCSTGSTGSTPSDPGIH